MWSKIALSMRRRNESLAAAPVTDATAPLGGWRMKTKPASGRRRAKSARKDQDWRTWSRFRLWRKQRPFTGSVFMALAGLLVLWAPLCHFPMVLVPASPAWSVLLVGTLLVVMAGSQLFFPFYAPVTGAIGLLLSLASVLVALGGMGVGVLLGLIGSSFSIAWRPTSALRQQIAANLVAPPKARLRSVKK